MDIVDTNPIILSPTFCGDFKRSLASLGNSTASLTRHSTTTNDDNNDDVNEVDDCTLGSDADVDDKLLRVEFEILSPSLVSYMKANSVYSSTTSSDLEYSDDDEDDQSMSVHLSWGVEILNELSERDAELEVVKTALTTCAEKLESAEKDLEGADQAREEARVAKSQLAILQAQLAITETSLIEKINEGGRLTNELNDAMNQCNGEAAKGRQFEKENKRLREDLDCSDWVNSALSELQENTSAWLEEEIEENLSLEGRIEISIEEETLHCEESKVSYPTKASQSNGFNIQNVLLFCFLLVVALFPISSHRTSIGSISSKKFGVFDKFFRTTKNKKIRIWSANSELIPMIME